jgi:hypothetical protein
MYVVGSTGSWIFYIAANKETKAHHQFYKKENSTDVVIIIRYIDTYFSD